MPYILLIVADKIQTIRVTETTNKQLKRFNNFLSDRNGGKYFSQEEALKYLLNNLEKTDLEEYKQWLFNEDIQFQSKELIKKELAKEREMGEMIFSLLCGNCQRHAAEIVEAME